MNKPNDVSHKKSFWQKYKYIIIFLLWSVLPYIVLNKTFRNGLLGIFTHFDNGSGIMNTIIFSLFLFIMMVLFGPTQVSLVVAYISGFWKGSLICCIISYLSTIFFFYLARKYFSKDMSEYIKEKKYIDKYFKIFDEDANLSDNDILEFVCLSRIGPIFPLSTFSMFWGITKIKESLFLIGTLSIIPWIIFTVYLGSKIKNISSLFKTDKLQLICYIVITIIVCYLIQIKISNILEKSNKKHKLTI
tara:strand:- start:734 stop:1471 length:738 start_codon:yes stop_codon:yes gene_type:complete